MEDFHLLISSNGNVVFLKETESEQPQNLGFGGEFLKNTFFSFNLK